MGSRGVLLLFVVLASVINFSAARAVNISNTWMLPEEGFPVFYRYFRDRISWYEADAVCQFHHAYLVTADTTSQYDAIRAYLKELDITDNVWIGLSKTSEKPNFTWTDFRPLSGEGHWHEDIPTANKDPMCVAMDPAKDFLWKPLSCGGPDVASFICEMPIPSWALGPKGCLLTELPSLTVLYIPEQSSLELTSDCGLDGTKRIACKGNADREEILKQLTCAVSHEDFEDKEKTTKIPINLSTIPDENSANSKTTRSWIWTSNTIDVDEGVPTRHRRGTEDTLSPVSSKSTPSTIINKIKGTRPSESSTATTYDTEVTTNNLNSDSTTDSPNVPEKSIERTDIETSTLDNVDSTSTEVESSTFGSTAETRIATTHEKGTGYTGTVQHEPEHLFSIIGNGTMFDIIELNDTTEPEHDLRTHEVNTATPTAEVFKPSKKLIQITDKSSKNVTEKNSKTKPISKKDIYKNADPKKGTLNQPKNITKFEQNLELNLTQEVEMVPLVRDDTLILNRTFRKGDEIHNKKEDAVPIDDSINKEIPIYPVVKDTSIRLNRTFRKELPSEDYMEVNEINEPPAIPKSVENNFLENENKDVLINETTKNQLTIDTNQTKENAFSTAFKKEDKTTASSRIDPKLDDLNTNLTNNADSDLVEIFNPHNSNPTNDEALKRQLLPKSLLNTEEKHIKSTFVSATDDSKEKEENLEEQPKPNRQRQLTRPQRRSFYPSFFSRVLG